MVDAYDRAFHCSTPVIAVDEPGAEVRRYPPEVIGRILKQDRASYAAAAEFVNRYPVDLVNIQHEYGLFGGERGEWLVDFLRAMEKPVVLTLHTVLPEPDETYLRVTRELCAHATKVIALSETGRGYSNASMASTPSSSETIHHGVPDVPFQDTYAAKASWGIGQRTVISTFGLISRGKGLEYAIDAMRGVVKRHPEALYLILGETHPVVRRQEGESYRESLHALVHEYGLHYNVQLVDKYLDFDEVVSYLTATDIYLTPYLNPAQIVSGTLAYAVGCGKAIVSTPYLYAQELLAHNRGFLCDFRDAASITQRLNMLLDDPALRRATERRAYRFGRQMTWPHVAAAYGDLFSELVSRDPLNW